MLKKKKSVFLAFNDNCTNSIDNNGTLIKTIDRSIVLRIWPSSLWSIFQQPWNVSSTCPLLLLACYLAPFWQLSKNTKRGYCLYLALTGPPFWELRKISTKRGVLYLAKILLKWGYSRVTWVTLPGIHLASEPHELKMQRWHTLKLNKNVIKAGPSFN